MDRPMPERMSLTPGGRKRGSREPVLARAPGSIPPSQSSPSSPATFAWHPPVLALMTSGAFGRFVVEDNQGVDGDACLGIEKKRVDVDRGDPAACIRHQV